MSYACATSPPARSSTSALFECTVTLQIIDFSPILAKERCRSGTSSQSNSVQDRSNKKKSILLSRFYFIRFLYETALSSLDLKRKQDRILLQFCFFRCSPGSNAHPLVVERYSACVWRVQMLLQSTPHFDDEKRVHLLKARRASRAFGWSLRDCRN